MRASSLIAVAVLLVSACGGGGGSTPADGSVDGSDAGDPIVSVVVSPANPVLEVVDGVVTPLTFSAKAVRQSGIEEPLSGAWSYDRASLGAIDASTGTFTPSGTRGGLGTVHFDAGSGRTADTNATVRLVFSYAPTTIEPALKAAFDGASVVDPALDVLYPYDETVFPRGLAAPSMQWDGGGADDVYRIRVVGAFVAYEAFAVVPPPSRFSIDASTWEAIAGSTDGALEVSIQRHDGATAYLAANRTWTIAPAELSGMIYLWSVSVGAVQRMRPGDTSPSSFLEMPVGTTCVSCHSVSKSGNRIVASQNGGASPWAVFDTATGEPTYATNAASGYQAISPDGAYVLWGQWTNAAYDSTGSLMLSAADSISVLATLTPGGGDPSHPAWSPDGTKIAFSVRTDGNGLDFTTSSLWLTRVDVATPGFSNTTMIVPSGASRPTLSYPAFTPGSDWIAFARATQARHRDGLSDLALTNLDGSVVIDLDRANGTGVLSGNAASSSYEPDFMPIAAGGYLWMVFVAQRPYGNTITDTNRATRTSQLWIAAVDPSPVAGQDPSHPAFWLPGQDAQDVYLRGVWAGEP